MLNETILFPKQHEIALAKELIREISQEYPPLAPIPAKDPPFLGPKYRTAEDAITALSQNTNPARENTLFSRITNDMRNNPQEMLKLIQEHPRAFSLIGPDLQNKEFYLQALAANHRVYDLLPEEMLRNPDILNQYRESLFANPIEVAIDKNDWGHIYMSVPVISERCQIEDLVTESGYKKLLQDAAAGKGLSQTKGDDFHRGHTLGAILAMKALRPEAEEMFLKAEREVCAKQLTQQIRQNPHRDFGHDFLILTTLGSVHDIKGVFDVDGYLQHAAKQAMKAMHWELSAPAKSAEEAVKTAAEANKKAIKFRQQLTGYYKEVYDQAFRQAREERDAFTPEEKDLRHCQQWAYETPRGSRLLDESILSAMEKTPPEVLKKHLDVKEYLERRTEVLINARTIQERQDALHFWSAVSQSKQAHDIVFNKLAQIDKKPPQWLETMGKLATYSHDITPTIKKSGGLDEISQDIGRSQ